MKLMPALFTAFALTTAAGMAQADIGPDEVIRLQKSGAVGDFEQFNKQALAKHPGFQIHDTELERHAGRYVYQIELKDAKGVEWDFEVDAKTGEVLRDAQDR
ncbi:peptidase [Pseudomonas cichorii]|uniref:Peptidase n=2 Tax=Pseudomonas syringae group TaxID=136849 RepID=A0A3M3T7L4_PSECI|nr:MULTISPECIES: PepSY domain-containing protein [Pseudomonas]AHF69028.1 peptidase [Pseudomonas cichorii JBC1]MBI6853841.1 PepSY domain-containing protein [Pseudomonas cichorii]MBX8484362.1 PepSY domain-containing protein [Pseudomonas cichorii]MBX8497226.1 PepSY domain-containing protein [Pseudomonas cichorii]MBX8516476.1 PepSY domain-containing protein [Pseudomonas cichorii]